VFLAGVCFSAYFCWQMWTKWDESPILTSLETNHYSNDYIPFPAVTICNVNKVSKRKLLQFLNTNSKFVKTSTYVLKLPITISYPLFKDLITYPLI